MILLNLNDLIKFALESATNYLGTLFLLGMLGMFGSAILVYVAEKLGGVLITSIMVARGKDLSEISKTNDDEAWRLEKLW